LPNAKSCFFSRCLECTAADTLCVDFDLDDLAYYHTCFDKDCYDTFVCHTIPCPEVKTTMIFRTSIGELTEGEVGDFENWLAVREIPLDSYDDREGLPRWGIVLQRCHDHSSGIRLDTDNERFVLCSDEDVPKDKRSQNKHKKLMERYDEASTKSRISIDKQRGTYQYRAIFFMQKYKELADKIRQANEKFFCENNVDF